MVPDKAEARRILWARYDAGAVTADEVESRLLLLDRAADGDETAIAAALDGPVPMRRRAAAHPKVLIVVAVGLALALGAGVVIASGDRGDGTRTATSGERSVPPFPGEVATTVVGFAGGAEDAACADLDVAPPAGERASSPSLLSNPPFLPEGYEVDDDETIEPGTDGDPSMSVAAGDPLPIDIRARSLDGRLLVRMRTFIHASVEDADAAAASLEVTACGYGATPFDVPDRPEINGTVVTGVIPTTAFAGWRLGERRFLVAVEAATDDADDIAEARQLAGEVAAAELFAARNPAPDPPP